MNSSTLFQLRNTYQLSKTEISNMLHISRMTYYYYEIGWHRPPLEILYALAEYYQIPLDYLFGHCGAGYQPTLPEKKKLVRPTVQPQDKLLIILGKRLQALRVSKNLPQTAIAELLGISRPAYSYYENGRRQPPAESLILLADYFHVSIDWLCGRE